MIDPHHRLCLLFQRLNSSKQAWMAVLAFACAILAGEATTRAAAPPATNATAKASGTNATDELSPSPPLPPTTNFRASADTNTLGIVLTNDSLALESNLASLVESTNAPSSEPPLSHSNALQKQIEVQAAPAGSNLVARGSEDPKLTLARQALQELDQARKQRREIDPIRMESRLKWILEEPRLPEAIKRSALLEMANLIQDTGQFIRANQIYAQFLRRYPDDPASPEILLRQGLVYRQMGAYNLALNKFYAVMSSALNLKMQQLEYYQRLVVHAQSEIADTYYLQGKQAEAAEFFGRLLKLNHPDLNKPYIMYKQIRSLAAQDKHDEVSALCKIFLERYRDTAETPEIRFQLATSLRKLDRKEEAYQQVLELLQQQEGAAAKNPELWTYWQQRAGNEIANQLYQEGDIFNALTIYQKLATLNQTPQWQAPVLYQTALVYEKLRQYPKAMDIYARIIKQSQEVGTNTTPSLTAVFELAQWRQNNLQWCTNVETMATLILGEGKPSKTAGANK